MKQHPIEFSALHLTHQDFQTIETTTDAELREAFSAHLAECSLCAEHYVDYLSSSELLSLPEGFSDRLLEAVAPKHHPLTGRNTHFIQVFKVSIAAVFAVTMYTSGMADKLMQSSAQMSGLGKHPSFSETLDKDSFDFKDPNWSEHQEAEQKNSEKDVITSSESKEENEKEMGKKLPPISVFGEKIKEKFYAFTRSTYTWFSK